MCIVLSKCPKLDIERFGDGLTGDGAVCERHCADADRCAAPCAPLADQLLDLSCLFAARRRCGGERNRRDDRLNINSCARLQTFVDARNVAKRSETLKELTAF